MIIDYKYFDGRYEHHNTTVAMPVKDYNGHEIYSETGRGWYFVKDNDDNYQYFGTMREAKTFIDNMVKF